MLDRIEAWPKGRILTAWLLCQAGVLLLVWSVFFVAFHVDFKGPIGPDVVRGIKSLVDALPQLEFWGWYGASAGLIAILQAAILLPVRKPAPAWKAGQGPAAHAGRSMWLTIAAAGSMCGLLWGGAVLAAADAVWLVSGRDWAQLDEAWRWLVVPPALGWIVATPLLVRFARGGRREDRLGCLASRLFLGTIIEVVAIIPLDVMVRRRTDCYCERGTFLALVGCGTVGLAALGPAVLLPLLARRRKRWYASRCEVCLYDMAGTPGAERCPECGSGWRRAGEDR